MRSVRKCLKGAITTSVFIDHHLSSYKTIHKQNLNKRVHKIQINFKVKSSQTEKNTNSHFLKFIKRKYINWFRRNVETFFFFSKINEKRKNKHFYFDILSSFSGARTHNYQFIKKKKETP